MKRFFTAALLAFLLSLSGCAAAGSPEIRRIQNIDTAMGTVVAQTLYTAGAASEAAQEITGLVRRMEKEELSRRLEGSQIWEVNAAAGRPEGIALSAAMEEILAACREMWQKSGGSFDVTLAPVVSLWDIDGWAAGEREGMFAAPEPEQVSEALRNCGSGRLRIDGGRLYLPEGMELDLGAVGKGIALDRILDRLREKDEITGATISLGGAVLTYGGKPDGKPWNVGVTNPADPSSYAGILSLEGEWFVSTSGDYERYAEAGGVRYHHIIDPSTGYPADSGVAGVTILAKDGFLSDALSTACFVLGAEEGMALAQSCGAEALFIAKDGSVAMSDGMRERFHAQ